MFYKKDLFGYVQNELNEVLCKHITDSLDNNHIKEKVLNFISAFLTNRNIPHDIINGVRVEIRGPQVIIHFPSSIEQYFIKESDENINYWIKESEDELYRR